MVAKNRIRDYLLPKTTGPIPADCPHFISDPTYTFFMILPVRGISNAVALPSFPT